MAKITILDNNDKIELQQEINNLSQEKVKGVGIKNIVKLTQAEYDAMTSHDATTLYVIEG